MRNIVLSVFFCVLSLTSLEVFACTSFIVSGSVTPDGRPILFKNRDTGELRNALAYFNDGKYSYIGLVNSDSTWNTMVWGGFNSVGFSIINTAAYNNNVGDTSKLIDLEGVIMKLALQYCATLADFEVLLDTIKKPMGVDANFGVIDAKGGAAYYETGNYSFVKYDVNDVSVAPNGILIRTNHSFSGDSAVGSGYIRYETARIAIDQAIKDSNYSPQYLLNSISRNLTHSLTGTNLLNDLPESADTPDFRFFTDYIARSSTASTIMIVGTANDKDFRQTTMWTVLGLPLVSVAVPILLTNDGNLPKVVSMGKGRMSPLCAAALNLRNECFPITRGNGRNYINLSVVANKMGTGYLQRLKPVEDEIFARTKSALKSDYSEKRIVNLYNWIDRFLLDTYKTEFKIDLW